MNPGQVNAQQLLIRAVLYVLISLVLGNLPFKSIQYVQTNGSSQEDEGLIQKRKPEQGERES
jgi:hypothetical protein